MVKDRSEFTSGGPMAFAVLKETDGIVEYHHRFASIIAKFNLSEEYLLGAYLAGLKVDAKKHIESFHPKSVRDCFILGKIYERMVKIRKAKESEEEKVKEGSHQNQVPEEEQVLEEKSIITGLEIEEETFQGKELNEMLSIQIQEEESKMVEDNESNQQQPLQQNANSLKYEVSILNLEPSQIDASPIACAESQSVVILDENFDHLQEASLQVSRIKNMEFLARMGDSAVKQRSAHEVFDGKLLTSENYIKKKLKRFPMSWKFRFKSKVLQRRHKCGLTKKCVGVYGCKEISSVVNHLEDHKDERKETYILFQQIDCFNALTLVNKLSVFTYHVPHPMRQGPTRVNVGYGQLAVGPRWLAYAFKSSMIRKTECLNPQNFTSSHSFSTSSSLGENSLMVCYSMDSGKQLANGFSTKGTWDTKHCHDTAKICSMMDVLL